MPFTLSHMLTISLVGATLIVMIGIGMESIISSLDDMLVPCQHGTEYNKINGRCRCEDTVFTGKFCGVCNCEHGQCMIGGTTPRAGSDYGCKCPFGTKRFGFLCDLCFTEDANTTCTGKCLPKFYGALCDKTCQSELSLNDLFAEQLSEDAQVCKDIRNNGGTCNMCSGHGTCSTNGNCICDANYFDGPDGDCSRTCPLATNGLMCSGHGACEDISGQPSCACEFGYRGTDCSLACPGMNVSGVSCFGHGNCLVDYVSVSTSCQCAQKFRGVSCEIECPGDIVACNGHGTCDDFGICSCSSEERGVDWVGPKCNCSDFISCSGHGSCSSSGVCQCTGNFQGQHCRQCKPNYYGSECQFYCDSDGEATEDVMGCYARGVCAIFDFGTTDESIGCECLDTAVTIVEDGAQNTYTSNYEALDNCKDCSPNYLPRVNVSDVHSFPDGIYVPCQFYCDEAICNNLGVCNDLWGTPGENLCICETGPYQNKHLDHSNFCLQCQSHWFPDNVRDDMGCTNFCVSDLALNGGSFPVECSSGDISCRQCSGNGVCSAEGTCLCNEGFTGEECSIQCIGDNGVECSGHGKCVVNPMQALMQHQYKFENNSGALYSCECDPQDAYSDEERRSFRIAVANGEQEGELEAPPLKTFYGDKCQYNCKSPPWLNSEVCNGFGSCEINIIRNPIGGATQCTTDADCEDNQDLAALLSGVSDWSSEKGPFCNKESSPPSCETSNFTNDDCYYILSLQRPQEARSKECMREEACRTKMDNFDWYNWCQNVEIRTNPVVGCPSDYRHYCDLIDRDEFLPATCAIVVDRLKTSTHTIMDQLNYCYEKDKIKFPFLMSDSYRHTTGSDKHDEIAQQFIDYKTKHTSVRMDDTTNFCQNYLSILNIEVNHIRSDKIYLCNGRIQHNPICSTEILELDTIWRPFSLYCSGNVINQYETLMEAIRNRQEGCVVVEEVVDVVNATLENLFSVKAKTGEICTFNEDCESKSCFKNTCCSNNVANTTNCNACNIDGGCDCIAGAIKVDNACVYDGTSCTGSSFWEPNIGCVNASIGEVCSVDTNCASGKCLSNTCCSTNTVDNCLQCGSNGICNTCMQGTTLINNLCVPELCPEGQMWATNVGCVEKPAQELELQLQELLTSTCDNAVSIFPTCKYITSACDVNGVSVCNDGDTCVSEGPLAICTTSGVLNATCKFNLPVEPLSFSTYQCDASQIDQFQNKPENERCLRKANDMNWIEYCVSNNPIVYHNNFGTDGVQESIQPSKLNLYDHEGKGEFLSFWVKTDSGSKRSASIVAKSGDDEIFRVFLHQLQIQLNEIETLQACPLDNLACHEDFLFPLNEWEKVDIHLNYALSTVELSFKGKVKTRSFLCNNCVVDHLTEFVIEGGSASTYYDELLFTKSIPEPEIVSECQNFTYCNMEADYKQKCADIILNVKYPLTAEPKHDILKTCQQRFEKTRYTSLDTTSLIMTGVYDLDTLDWLKFCQLQQEINMDINCSTLTYSELENIPNQCQTWLEPIDVLSSDYDLLNCTKKTLHMDWPSQCNLIKNTFMPEEIKEVCSPACYKHLYRYDQCSVRQTVFSSNVDIPFEISGCNNIHWLNYCDDVAKNVHPGLCSAVECNCRDSQNEGMSGEACELHCNLASDGSPCGIDSNVGVCKYTEEQEKQLEEGPYPYEMIELNGECECFFTEGSQNCDQECAACTNTTYLSSGYTVNLQFGNNSFLDFTVDGKNDPTIEICAGSSVTFSRTTAGHPLRLVRAEDCDTCASGTYTTLPFSNISGWVDVVLPNPTTEAPTTTTLAPTTTTLAPTTNTTTANETNSTTLAPTTNTTTANETNSTTQAPVTTTLPPSTTQAPVTTTLPPSTTQAPVTTTLSPGEEGNSDDGGESGGQYGGYYRLRSTQSSTTITLLEPGTYYYVCSSHPNMVGKIIVRECGGQVGVCDSSRGLCQCLPPFTKEMEIHYTTWKGEARSRMERRYDLPPNVDAEQELRIRMMQGKEAFVRQYLDVSVSQENWEDVYDDFSRDPSQYMCAGKACDFHDFVLLGNLAETSYSYNFDCSKTCPAVDENTKIPCSGHGRCMHVGSCSCDPAKVIRATDASSGNTFTINVFGGQSFTDSEFLVSKLEQTGWRGEDCSIRCPGYDDERLDMTEVCSGRGVCNQEGTCQCDIGFTGENCQFLCPGFSEGDKNVCSGHGTCSMSDVAIYGDVFAEFDEEYVINGTIISQKTNEQRSCPLPATKEVCLGYSVIHDIGFVDITKISLIKENSLCSSPTQEKCKLWKDYQSLYYQNRQPFVVHDKTKPSGCVIDGDTVMFNSMNTQITCTDGCLCEGLKEVPHAVCSVHDYVQSLNGYVQIMEWNGYLFKTANDIGRKFADASLSQYECFVYSDLVLEQPYIQVPSESLRANATAHCSTITTTQQFLQVTHNNRCESKSINVTSYKGNVSNLVDINAQICRQWLQNTSALCITAEGFLIDAEIGQCNTTTRLTPTTRIFNDSSTLSLFIDENASCYPCIEGWNDTVYLHGGIGYDMQEVQEPCEPIMYEINPSQEVSESECLLWTTNNYDVTFFETISSLVYPSGCVAKIENDAIQKVYYNRHRTAVECTNDKVCIEKPFEIISYSSIPRGCVSIDGKIKYNTRESSTTLCSPQYKCVEKNMEVAEPKVVYHLDGGDEKYRLGEGKFLMGDIIWTGKETPTYRDLSENECLTTTVLNQMKLEVAQRFSGNYTPGMKWFATHVPLTAEECLSQELLAQMKEDVPTAFEIYSATLYASDKECTGEINPTIHMKTGGMSYRNKNSVTTSQCRKYAEENYKQYSTVSASNAPAGCFMRFQSGELPIVYYNYFSTSTALCSLEYRCLETTERNKIDMSSKFYLDDYGEASLITIDECEEYAASIFYTFETMSSSTAPKGCIDDYFNAKIFWNENLLSTAVCGGSGFTNGHACVKTRPVFFTPFDPTTGINDNSMSLEECKQFAVDDNEYTWGGEGSWPGSPPACHIYTANNQIYYNHIGLRENPCSNVTTCITSSNNSLITNGTNEEPVTVDGCHKYAVDNGFEFKFINDISSPPKCVQTSLNFITFNNGMPLLDITEEECRMFAVINGLGFGAGEWNSDPSGCYQDPGNVGTQKLWYNRATTLVDCAGTYPCLAKEFDNTKILVHYNTNDGGDGLTQCSSTNICISKNAALSEEDIQKQNLKRCEKTCSDVENCKFFSMNNDKCYIHHGCEELSSGSSEIYEIEGPGGYVTGSTFLPSHRDVTAEECLSPDVAVAIELNIIESCNKDNATGEVSLIKETPNKKCKSARVDFIFFGGSPDFSEEQNAEKCFEWLDRHDQFSYYGDIDDPDWINNLFSGDLQRSVNPVKTCLIDLTYPSLYVYEKTMGWNDMTISYEACQKYAVDRRFNFVPNPNINDYLRPNGCYRIANDHVVLYNMKAHIGITNTDVTRTMCSSTFRCVTGNYDLLNKNTDDFFIYEIGTTRPYVTEYHTRSSGLGTNEMTFDDCRNFVLDYNSKNAWTYQYRGYMSSGSHPYGCVMVPSPPSYGQFGGQRFVFFNPYPHSGVHCSGSYLCPYKKVEGMNLEYPDFSLSEAECKQYKDDNFPNGLWWNAVQDTSLPQGCIRKKHPQNPNFDWFTFNYAKRVNFPCKQAGSACIKRFVPHKDPHIFVHVGYNDMSVDYQHCVDLAKRHPNKWPSWDPVEKGEWSDSPKGCIVDRYVENSGYSDTRPKWYWNDYDSGVACGSGYLGPGSGDSTRVDCVQLQYTGPPNYILRGLNTNSLNKTECAAHAAEVSVYPMAEEHTEINDMQPAGCYDKEYFGKIMTVFNTANHTDINSKECNIWNRCVSADDFSAIDPSPWCDLPPLQSLYIDSEGYCNPCIKEWPEMLDLEPNETISSFFLTAPSQCNPAEIVNTSSVKHGCTILDSNLVYNNFTESTSSGPSICKRISDNSIHFLENQKCSEYEQILTQFELTSAEENDISVGEACTYTVNPAQSHTNRIVFNTYHTEYKHSETGYKNLEKEFSPYCTNEENTCYNSSSYRICRRLTDNKFVLLTNASTLCTEYLSYRGQTVLESNPETLDFVPSNCSYTVQPDDASKNRIVFNSVQNDLYINVENETTSICNDPDSPCFRSVSYKICKHKHTGEIVLLPDERFLCSNYLTEKEYVSNIIAGPGNESDIIQICDDSPDCGGYMPLIPDTEATYFAISRVSNGLMQERSESYKLIALDAECNAPLDLNIHTKSYGHSIMFQGSVDRPACRKYAIDSNKAYYFDYYPEKPSGCFLQTEDDTIHFNLQITTLECTTNHTCLESSIVRKKEIGGVYYWDDHGLVDAITEDECREYKEKNNIATFVMGTWSTVPDGCSVQLNRITKTHTNIVYFKNGGEEQNQCGRNNHVCIKKMGVKFTPTSPPNSAIDLDSCAKVCRETSNCLAFSTHDSKCYVHEGCESTESGINTIYTLGPPESGRVLYHYKKSRPTLCMSENGKNFEEKTHAPVLRSIKLLSSDCVEGEIYSSLEGKCVPFTDTPRFETTFFLDKGTSHETTIEIECQVLAENRARCALCSCISDYVYGKWGGYQCETCDVGFAKSQCRSICPGFDGENRNSVCHGFGTCLFGSDVNIENGERIFQEGTCVCGQEDQYADREPVNEITGTFLSSGGADDDGSFVSYYYFTPVPYPDSYLSLYDAQRKCNEFNDIENADRGAFCFGVYRKYISTLAVSPEVYLAMGYVYDSYMLYGKFWEKKAISGYTQVFKFKSLELYNAINGLPLIQHCKDVLSIRSDGSDTCNHFDPDAESCDRCANGWTGKNCRIVCQKCLLGGQCSGTPSLMTSSSCECPQGSGSLWEHQCCPTGFMVNDKASWNSKSQRDVDSIRLSLVYDSSTTNELDAAYYCKTCPGISHLDWMSPDARYKVCSGPSRGECMQVPGKLELGCNCKINAVTQNRWQGRACSCDESISTPYSNVAASAESTDYGCLIPTNGNAVCPTSTTDQSYFNPPNVWGQDASFIRGRSYGSPVFGGIAGQVFSTQKLFCSPSDPCHTGEGPCDSDSDCAGSLKCFIRDGGEEKLSFNNEKIPFDMNYCFHEEETMVGCHPVDFEPYLNTKEYNKQFFWNSDSVEYDAPVLGEYVPYTFDANRNLVIHQQSFPCPQGRYGITIPNKINFEMIHATGIRCEGDQYVTVYNDDVDNPGSLELQQQRCFEGCIDHLPPINGSWQGRRAKFFLLQNGTCVCGMDDLISCNKTTSTFSAHIIKTEGSWHVCEKCQPGKYQNTSGNIGWIIVKEGRNTHTITKENCKTYADWHFYEWGGDSYTSHDGNTPYGCTLWNNTKVYFNNAQNDVPCALDNKTFCQFNMVITGMPQLSVSKSQCEQYATENGMAFSESSEAANPKGCFTQYDTHVYYNTETTSSAECGSHGVSFCVEQSCKVGSKEVCQFNIVTVGMPQLSLSKSQCEQYAVENDMSFTAFEDVGNPKGCFTQYGTSVYYNTKWTSSMECGSHGASFCVEKSCTVDVLNHCVQYGGGEGGEERHPNCLNCPPGRFGGPVGSWDVSLCEVCEPGTVKNPSGTGCEACTPGKYELGGSCLQCPVGTYSPEGYVGTLRNPCITCPRGRDTNGQIETGGEDASACRFCPGGTYNAIPGRLCTKCDAGKHASGVGNTKCEPCGVHEFANTAGMEDCLQCGVDAPYIGLYAHTDDRVECQQCNRGYKIFQGNCRPCDEGKAQPSLTTLAYECETCPEGTYAPAEGTESCKECETGKYQAQGGQSSCSSCSEGEYQDEKGQSDGCKKCGVGTYSTGGNSACTECETGKYNDIEANFGCKQCSQHHYQDEKGKSSCKECPAGKYGYDSKSATLAQACADCQAGRYNMNTASTCTPCEPGRYNDQTGSTASNSCKLCSKGHYSSTGARSCTEGCANTLPGNCNGQTCACYRAMGEGSGPCTMFYNSQLYYDEGYACPVNHIFGNCEACGEDVQWVTQIIEFAPCTYCGGKTCRTAACGTETYDTGYRCTHDYCHSNGVTCWAELVSCGSWCLKQSFSHCHTTRGGKIDGWQGTRYKSCSSTDCGCAVPCSARKVVGCFTCVEEKTCTRRRHWFWADC